MKKFTFAFLFALIAFSAQAQQQPFVTTWEVYPNELSSITIPTTGTGYNYTIDFGDGTIVQNVTGNITHTYNSPGIYTVSISGDFPRICFGCNPLVNSNMLQSIEQWGDIQWSTMEEAFVNCDFFQVNATDIPDLSQVTSVARMFKGAGTSLEPLFTNQSINNWDVSNVTDMSEMFMEALAFNQPINNWDVSNVTDMSGMFEEAVAFNQPINNWDVSSVTDMSNMFKLTHGFNSFNQPLDNWDVSNVTDMSFMFLSSRFNQSLNNWDVSNVTNMSWMFFSGNFNQPINNWDVSSVTNMNGMLGGTNFNQPINNWDVSNVTNMASMFEGTSDFNQPLDNWDVSNVTDISNMFKGAASFNQPLNSWDVSNVTNMEGMFSKGTFDSPNIYNQPLNNWDVSSVTNMADMFYGATLFNQPLDNWDVSGVTNMSEMFAGTIAFNQDLNNWDVLNVVDMDGMFENASSFNQPLDNWDVSNVTYMSSMFAGASSFNQPLDNWDVSNVAGMGGMFENASSFNQDLSNWDFNHSVSFTELVIFGADEVNFISYSGLDVNNYDALLLHLVSLDLEEDQLGADGLKYCNQGVRNELINNGWTIYGDSVSPNCNAIIGNVPYDENNNGCAPNDIGVNGFMVKVDDGTYDFTTFVENGSYNAGINGTNFTVSVINTPAYYTVTPPSATVTFTTSDTEQQDFCVTANQSVEDLNVTLLPISQARPGFEADYQLVVENRGTQSVATATLTLSFDDTKQSFVSAVPSPTTTTTNQLTFDLSNMLPFESRSIDFTMQTFTPPTVNGGDVLSFTASVTPDANDNTPEDNTFDFDQTVVNSFDPNDKQVLQGEEIFISEADEYLNYLIRFQNTGTASAINVRVLDTLHPKLDWGSIRPVNASHDYRVEITDGNHVEFIFENINLPHEAADEPGSHGFIAYKIKPKNNVQIGDFITGTARIYFDFNQPILTNTVSTEIVENLSSENFGLANSLQLYPNPTKGTLHISSKTELEQVEVFSLTGNRLLLQETNLKKIDLHQFSNGIYFLKITDESGGEVVRKIVKK